MTKLALALTVFLTPLLGMSSWGQDIAYYQAAHTWQQVSPATYYAHSTFVLILVTIIVRRRSQRCGQRI